MTGISKELHIEPAPLHQLDSNKEVFQTGFWARLKEQFGWIPAPVKILYKNTPFTMLVLLRNFGFGLYIGYVPMGPCIQEPESGKEDFLINLAREIKAIVPYTVTFLRFDLPWGRVGEDNYPGSLHRISSADSQIPDKGTTGRAFLCKAPVDIQPSHTIILRIDKPEEEVLTLMKHKTRYNIRLSERKGVKVCESGEEALADWYNLYRQTAIRDRIALHSFEYYHRFFCLAKEYSKENISVKLLTAYVDNAMVAGIIMVIKGETAWYMYGASSNKKRNYMPNHALQWAAIRLAREAGCKYYDFFGIPPQDDPEHSMHGLYRFKTGFGGDFVHRYGCYDVVLNPLYYRGYTIAEKARTFYYKKIKKKLG